MRRSGLVVLAFAAAVGTSRLARAEDPVAPVPSPVAPPADRVAWTATLADAFEQGKRDGKPIFVAVNSERVDGGKLEPAGEMLRERVYLDPAVVAKSRSFACALLRGDASSADFGEVRARFGLDGQIVSPQHLFAFPDGTLIKQHEYWQPVYVVEGR